MAYALGKRLVSAPRFGLQADYYARFRPGYPDALWRLFDEAVGRRGVGVELGAGAGQATSILGDRFDRLVVVEPDAEMAARIAPRGDLDIRVGPAESAEFAPASVDAVMAFTSFHWMDAAVVCRRIAEWLKPGGVFWASSYGPPVVDGPDAARAAFAKWEARWRPYMDARLIDWRPYAGLVAGAGAFRDLRCESVPFTLEWPAETFAGFCASTSYGAGFARAEFDDVDRFVDALTKDFRAAAGDATVRVRMDIEIVIARNSD